MSRLWEYGGFLIDEGQKPRDGHFKEGFYQYFFIIKEGDRRVMKYCVWAGKDEIEQLQACRDFLADGKTAVDFVRHSALERVKAKIDRKDFSNTLLRVGAGGFEEVALDRARTKVE